MRFFVLLALVSALACDDRRQVADAGDSDGLLSDDLAPPDLATADLSTIVVVDAADAAAPDLSSPDLAAPIVATELRFTVQPIGEFSGVPFAVEVALTDSLGRVATTNSCAISIALNVNTQGGLLSGTTTVNTVDGRARFGDLRVDTFGSPYVLTASCAGFADVSSDSFGVAASRLSIYTQPTYIDSGGTVNILVDVEDAAGHIDRTATPTVTISIYSGPSGGKVSGTVTQVLQSGQAYFTVALDRAGRYRLLVSAGTPNISGVTAGPIDVRGTTCVFLDQPTDIDAGTTLAPLRVEIQDITGMRDTTSTGYMRVDGCGAYESELAIAGVATFTSLVPVTASPDCRLAANYVAQSDPFAVNAGPAAKLVMAVAPYGVARYLPSPFEIAVADLFGNQISTATPEISLSISGAPANAVLSGTTKQTAVAGRAKFTDISIDLGGSFTLFATAPGLETLLQSMQVTAWGHTEWVVAVDPRDAKIIYGGSRRLQKSLDGGTIWRDITPPSMGTADLGAHWVAIDPSDSMTIYATVCGAPYSSTSIFHSADGGSTWDREFLVASNSYDAQIAVSPTKPSTVYVLFSGAIMRSQDSGLTWQNTGGLSMSGLTVTGESTLFSTDSNGALQRSRDGGVTWVNLNVSRKSSVAVDPQAPAHLIAMSQTDTRISNDGGDTWSLWLPSPTFLGGLWAVFDPKDSNTIYAALFGPTSYPMMFYPMVTHDGGTTWTSWSSNSKPLIAPSNPLMMYSDGSRTATGGL